MKQVAVALVLVLLSAAAGWSMRGDTGTTITRVDTVTPEAYQELLRERTIEAHGLRARLEGRTERQPEIIVRTDTVVPAPDTVYELVRVEDGRLDIGMLIGTDSALFAPELVANIDIADCDEGWAIQSGTVVCDRAQLGHVYIYAALSGAYVPPGVTADAEAGVWWQPAYGSPWRVEAGVTTERTLQLTVRRGWRIF